MSSFRLENNDSDNNHNNRLKSLEEKTSLLNTNPTRYSYTKFVSTSETLLSGMYDLENVIPDIHPSDGKYSPPNEAKEGSVYRLTIVGRYRRIRNSLYFTINFLNSTRTYELENTVNQTMFKLDILNVIKRISNNIAQSYELTSLIGGVSPVFSSTQREYEPTQESSLQIEYTSVGISNTMTIENVIFEKIA